MYVTSSTSFSPDIQTEKYWRFKRINYWRKKIRRWKVKKIKSAILFQRTLKMMKMEKGPIMRVSSLLKRNKNQKNSRHSKGRNLSSKRGLCSKSVNLMRFHNLRLLQNMISYRSTWYFWSREESKATKTTWMTQFSFTSNRFASCWRESGSFSRLSLWLCFKRYYLIVQN